MRIRLALASMLALVTGSGCTPSVGDVCDEDAARTPYYEMATGTPMYPGQALIIEHCVNCHGEGVAFGAPQGLNFPLGLVTATGEAAIAGGRRLLDAQSTVHRHRDLIYQQVEGRYMPPRGFVNTGLSRYADADGTPLPGIHSPEGIEALRNWLACGSPVVERTTALPSPCSSNIDCQVTNFCNVGMGQCVGVGDVVAPGGGGEIDCNAPESRWQWIYTCLFSGSTCASVGCHSAMNPASGLALPDAATAHGALVDVAPGAMSLSCGGREPYVVPGDADGSLLIVKLEGEANPNLCGSPMPVGTPLTADEIDLVREWINAGAAND